MGLGCRREFIGCCVGVVVFFCDCMEVLIVFEFVSGGCDDVLLIYEVGLEECGGCGVGGGGSVVVRTVVGTIVVDGSLKSCSVDVGRFVCVVGEYVSGGGGGVGVIAGVDGCRGVGKVVVIVSGACDVGGWLGWDVTGSVEACGGWACAVVRCVVGGGVGKACLTGKGWRVFG